MTKPGGDATPDGSEIMAVINAATTRLMIVNRFCDHTGYKAGDRNWPGTDRQT